MSVTYEIVPFGPEIETAYADLFPQGKPPEMLRWRYTNNPHGKGQFAVARDNDQIIGMIALIPTLLSAHKRVYRAVQAVDTIVSPHTRGKFIFVRMAKTIYENATELNADIIWGFPNAQAARGWFGRLGWTRFGMAPFLLRPLRTGYLFRQIVPALAKIDLPLMRKRIQPNSNVREISRFGRESDNLCATFNAEKQVGVEYSSDYLNWRLIDCPHTQYRTVGAYSQRGELIAMVSGTVLEKHGGRIFYLMEAISSRDDASQLRRLLKQELSQALRDGAEVAIAWNNSTAPNSRALRSAGFITLPERMRPVEIHFGAKSLTNSDASPLLDESSWYLSYLSSDTV